MTGSALGRGAVLQVEHPRQGSAVPGPTAPVREEVGGLRGAGTGSGTGEVVTAAEEAGGCGTVVVLGECGVGVGCSFGGLLFRV